MQHENDIIPRDFCLDGSGIPESSLINESKKPTALIEDWWYDGQRLWGKVLKHPEQDSFKMNCQMTSYVINIDLEEGFAETENTHYTLGTPKYLSGERVE